MVPLGLIVPHMASVKRSPHYRDWLAGAIEESGRSKREIARRMAVKHPNGVNTDTIETGRRTINKILAGTLNPTQPTRDLIAGALERADAPTVDDEDLEADMASVLRALAREQAALSRRLNRALKAATA
jgi:hypothetical protein